MPSKVFSAWKNGPGDVPTNLATIGSLELPPGAYAIAAKLYVAQGSGANQVTRSQITARLEAESDVDVTVTTVPIADENPFRSGASALALNVVHHFEKGGRAVVKLDKKPDMTPHLEWAWLKITAIQVDPPVTNKPMA